MSSTKNPGRFAGLLYVLTGIPGFFAIVYVPSKLLVDGNAPATADNIAASETLFRIGIAAQLISQAGFVFVALALYELFTGVSSNEGRKSACQQSPMGRRDRGHKLPGSQCRA